MISHVHESGTTYAKPPRKFEAGTCNLGAEAGLVEAIRYVESIGLDKIREHETELCRKALKGLKDIGGIDIYPAGFTGTGALYHLISEASILMMLLR